VEVGQSWVELDVGLTVCLLQTLLSHITCLRRSQGVELKVPAKKSL
jgi:hypothetical protein